MGEEENKEERQPFVAESNQLDPATRDIYQEHEGKSDISTVDTGFLLPLHTAVETVNNIQMINIGEWLQWHDESSYQWFAQGLKTTVSLCLGDEYLSKDIPVMDIIFIVSSACLTLLLLLLCMVIFTCVYLICLK